MAIDWSALKDRKAASQKRFDTIKEEATKTSDFAKEDTRFWQPTVDKAGNGYAVIRFLDAHPEETNAWVRYWDHGFKGPTGKWYIEKSLTTLGQPDPVSELNSQLWNTKVKANQDLASSQKRRLHYISNVLVISDKSNPENEGKVMLFKYGKKIHDKIKDAMSPPPEFEDEQPMNPFDFWSGADFKLKIRNVEGYRNYDKSEFDKPSPVGDDERIKEVWEQCYKLAEFVDPSQFKSYEELKAKLQSVLNPSQGGSAPKSAKDDEGVDPDTQIDYERGATLTTAKTETKAEVAKDDTSEGDDIEYFKNLAKDEEPF